MLVYLVRRVLWAVFLCFALTLVTYLIFFQIPADPARLVVDLVYAWLDPRIRLT